MRLNVLRTVLLRLQLFAQCRHKYSSGSNIRFQLLPQISLRDIGVRQHLSNIMREQTQKLVFNSGSGAIPPQFRLSAAGGIINFKLAVLENG